MSTTTGHDLLARAESISKELARCELSVDLQAWESFDTTAYRLLRELVGPGRSDSGASTMMRGKLLRVIHSYPTPLRPPLDTDLTATAAARFAPVSESVFRERLYRGEIEAKREGHTYLIASNDLDLRPDITPADPADPHPLARLSTTLGLLADLVSQERRQPKVPATVDDVAVHEVAARVLSYLNVAARYTLRHGPARDGGRPLVVAQYAEQFVDVLSGASAGVPLAGLAATVAGQGTSLNDRLDTALHRWATATDTELTRTVPSTQAMANTAELGALTLAATHHLRSLQRDAGEAGIESLTEQLRSQADALKGAAAAWKSVSTLQPQTREFGATSLETFKVLRDVITSRGSAELDQGSLDAARATNSLQRSLNDLTRFMVTAQETTRACLNSGLVFAPARALPTSHERLAERQRGAHIPLAFDEGIALLGPVWELELARASRPQALAHEEPRQPGLALDRN